MSPEDKKLKTDYDVVVVGAGTAGMESALTLGDMGYRVLLVEKEPSVGGKTILLSKVFPTLDCASCISTPKMAASAHHPNVNLMVYSEAKNIRRLPDGSFSMDILNKNKSVDPQTCTGCGGCEEVCTVAVPDQYNYDMVARRAAHIAFPQSVPKKSVIEREGTPPCTAGCPAGIKPSGFVSLVRAGRYEAAFKMHLDDAPLVGCLSRACYAPCEGECTRCEYEGTVNIRAIKRFMVDWYYDRHPEPEYRPVEKKSGKKAAIVGSGPAGLNAAFHLARAGHAVTIFEAYDEPGGMLRYGMPAYRLPNELIDRDIKNVTAAGVEIKTGQRIESIKKLKGQGFDAVYLGVGNHMPRIIPLKGEEHTGIENCLSFLKSSNVGTPPDIKGKRLIVIGGGNVAMDVSRSAVRLGAESVNVIVLEAADKMLAHSFEVEEAREEGINIHNSSVTDRIYLDDKGDSLLSFSRVKNFSFKGGKLDIEIEENSSSELKADLVVMAVGLGPDTACFGDELSLNKNGTIKVDEETLQTSMDGVFAGGDAVTGPSIMVEAMGQGRKAAFYIDNYLTGKDSSQNKYPDLLPMSDKKRVMELNKGLTERAPAAIPHMPPRERVQSFEAFEGTLSEKEARETANRCLDCGVCCQCQECVKACPADAIDFSIRDKEQKITAGSVILATGYGILDPGLKELFGYGRYPNVISGPQMDRLLAPTRPYNGVLRPSDGREPENIAIIMCMGARDHTVCNPLCCRVGCMYSAKHAQLMMGALPLADVTIYYIDVRAFGKGYDEFYEQAKGMGVQYVKGKVSRLKQLENGDLKVEYEDMENSKGQLSAQHDLVVLTVGIVPHKLSADFLAEDQFNKDEEGFITEADELSSPSCTSIPGIYTAGTVAGARDIPDTVIHSGAAASHAAVYVQELGKKAAGAAS